MLTKCTDELPISFKVSKVHFNVMFHIRPRKINGLFLVLARVRFGQNPGKTCENYKRSIF